MVVTLSSKQQWCRQWQLQQHMRVDSEHDSYFKNEK